MDERLGRRNVVDETAAIGTAVEGRRRSFLLAIFTVFISCHVPDLDEALFAINN